MENQVTRIERMEAILDRHTELVADVEKAVEAILVHAPEYEALKAYYGSDTFYEDMSASDAGRLPRDLRCGVLSEDAVFNLIGDHYEMTMRLLEVATTLLRQH